jgi:hypothetical protein
MRLLVFLHGRAIMHPGAVDRTREERPDVLIEDDGERIGAGRADLPADRPEVRAPDHVHRRPEFGGLDHLPDAFDDLRGS